MKRAKNNSEETSLSNKAGKEDVRSNALAVRDSIIADIRVAEKFFFVEMRPKMTALADSYNRAFGLELEPENVSRAAMLSCWENDWAKLRAFKGETTIHAWVGKMASQATYQLLVEEKYIDRVGNTKTGDYRLTVRGIESDFVRQAIVDMVYIPEQHKILEMYYVAKKDTPALARAFGSEEKAKAILKTAEKTLIDQLLNTENPYAEMALSAKKAVNPEMQFQSWHDRIDEDDECENKQTLREVLSDLYNNEDWDSNVTNFIESIVDSLGWNDIQKEVWRERFFNETPSKELALRLNVRNTWIDNTYSRLYKQFRIAVKTWWNHNLNV